MIALLAGTAALRAPIAPALDGYPLNRYLGLLPSFRRDAVGCMAAHAQHCREQGLDAVAMNMGLLGRFTLVTGAEQAAAIFEDRESIYFKSAIDRRGVGLLTGIGVLLADGKEHTRKRRLVLPCFEARRLERYVDHMSSVSNELADEWLQAADRAQASGTPSQMPVASTMSAAALRIVGLCLFSSDPSSTAASFARALEACLEHTVWVSRTALPPPRWLPTRRNRRFRRSLRTLDDFLYGMIRARRRYEQSGMRRAVEAVARARGEPVDDSEGDLLDMLLGAEVASEAGRGGGEDGQREASGGASGRRRAGRLVGRLLALAKQRAGGLQRGIVTTCSQAFARSRGTTDMSIARGGPAARSGPSATEVRDEAMTLLLAGHETSALALT